MASSQTPVEMSQMDTARPELERFTTADAVLKDPTASDEAQAKETVATKEDAPALTTDGAADATPAIGPAVDDDEAVDKVAAVASAASPPDDSADVPGSAVMVVLLLTTGARHPFRIDHRYLEKRSVTPAEGEPLNISVYTVKELIWRDWRDEWEPRPSSPSYIRLITFGRLLEDKNTLKDCKLSTEQPNVLHMTVKPADKGDDDGLAKGKASRSIADGENERAGCRCCLVM